MSRASIITSTGLTFDITETTLDMINIEDIAHALSQINRYTGHAKFPYPVAQHCRLGSYLFNTDALALRFLLHDASEAYLGDMNRPLKHFTAAGEAYRKVERDVQKLIYTRFGVFGNDPSAIHRVDTEMLYAEKEILLPAGTDWATDWSGEFGLERTLADVKIVETSFLENKRLYLDRFHQLYHGE